MPLEETLKRMAVTHFEFTTDNSRVIYSEDSVDVFHTLRSDVGQLLDLGCSVLDLANVST